MVSSPEGSRPVRWSGPSLDFRCADRDPSLAVRQSTPGQNWTVSALALHAALAEALRGVRRSDGAFPVSLDGPAEVEPTAIAALALDDSRARAWLATHLRTDGGFDERDGRADGPTSSALAALALADRRAARRALGYAIAHRGLPLPNARDPEKREGWGWTNDARSLTEPTARVLLAVNALTPDDGDTRHEAVGLLTARQCADGGWNFGNASVYDVDLRGYVQTTAIGLIALQRGDPKVVARAFDFLRNQWRLEPGGLTVAQSLVAFRLHGLDDEVPELVDGLATIARRPSFREKPLAVAWAVLATGPDRLLDPLRSRA